MEVAVARTLARKSRPTKGGAFFPGSLLCAFWLKNPPLDQRAATRATRPQFSQSAPFVGTFQELVEKQTRVRRVIIGIDSRLARRSIQNDLPFEVLNASDERTLHIALISPSAAGKANGQGTIDQQGSEFAAGFIEHRITP